MASRSMRIVFFMASFACVLAACGDDDSSTTESPRIFWAELTGNCSLSAIRWMDAEGSPPELVTSRPGPDSIADLVVDDTEAKVYFTFGGSSGNTTETLQRVNINGTGLETIATYTSPASDLTPRGIDLDLGADKVYWVANGGCTPCPSCGECSVIQRADLTGANPQPILTLTGTTNPGYMALDTQTEVLYWTDIQFAPHIKSAFVSGTGVDTVYTKPLGFTLGVGDVEVDLAHGKLYWLEQESSGNPALIRRSNLDGSSVETVLSAGGSQATTPRGLAVDPVAQKVYWTESNSCGNPASGRIRRANVDGTGVETVLDGLDVLVAIELVR